MNEEQLSHPLHTRQTKPERYTYNIPPGPTKTGHMVICCCLNIGIDPPGFTNHLHTSTTYNWMNVKDKWKREIGVDIPTAIAGNFQRYCGNQTTTESLCDPTTESIRKACSTARTLAT